MIGTSQHCSQITKLKKYVISPLLGIKENRKMWRTLEILYLILLIEPYILLKNTVIDYFVVRCSRLCSCFEVPFDFIRRMIYSRCQFEVMFFLGFFSYCFWGSLKIKKAYTSEEKAKHPCLIKVGKGLGGLVLCITGWIFK